MAADKECDFKALNRFFNNCPPVGGTAKFVVKCAGDPYTSHDDRDYAQKIAEMYGKNCKSGAKGTGGSANSLKDWTVSLNPNYKGD